MDIRSIIEWVSHATPTQFIIGVLILMFGSKKVFSEKNVEESLSGFRLPFKWLQERRERAAREEATEALRIKNDLQQSLREQRMFHAWAMEVMKVVHGWELWAARHGIELPEPPFRTLAEFTESRLDYPEEEDE